MSEVSAGMAVPNWGAQSEGPGAESPGERSDKEGVRASLADLYDYQSYGVECGGLFGSERFYSPYSEEAGEGLEESPYLPFYYYPEESPYLPFLYYPEEERAGSDVEKFLYRVPSRERRETVGRQPFLQDPRRKSLFVHSSPSHFPDISQARKSAFGSIFLRTTGHAPQDTALLKSVTDSSYSMLQSLLNSFEWIIASAFSDMDRKQMAVAYKQSLLKALEAHGISRIHSDGSIQWSIYPIARDYLFAVQIGDNMHQTRLLSRIEERIISGSLQRPRIPFAWPTDSVWTGHWDAVGMAGVGTYIMPHGVSYNGKLQNGVFHDDNATLTYPSKFKALHCVFVKGELKSCQFQFPDLLMHEEDNWGYCKAPDRRFWSEVRNGLKPAKIAQKTEVDPPVKIPKGSYDTSDGFYDPKSLMLTGPGDELLRVPLCEEDMWIKKYCRKGFTEPTDFRPDLFENWFNYDQDLIQSILKAQERYRAGKITYEELRQFYADLGLMPSWSKYKRRKTPSEIALEEYINSIPQPVPLRPPRKLKKYQGHALPSSVRATCADLSKERVPTSPTSEVGTFRASKSTLRFHKESGHKFTSIQALMNAKASRISFRLDGDVEKGSGTSREIYSDLRRKIPKPYLKYQPILKPPFPSRTRVQPLERQKKKCLRRSSSELSPPWDLVREEDFGEGYEMLDKRELRNFMTDIIMERVTNILEEERDRHRKRLRWARKVGGKAREGKGGGRERLENCLQVLGDVFDSIPEKEEYGDYYPKRTCDLKKLAEDKYQMLKFWGKKVHLLNFNEEAPL